MLKWLWISALVIAVDQITKWAVFVGMEYPSAIPVLPFFSLVHVHNTGAAFSFLADAAGWQRYLFLAIGLGASAFMLHLLNRHRDDNLMAISLALILGGALGNIIDRSWHGFVVDFFYFHYRAFTFPAFNVADSAISVGAALLILDALLNRRRHG
ncbi:MAG TPA: signal peptidase II [Thiobacillaceae bacterium]|nr:signal peptidase II [Thiobacillaceae bacterium]